MMVMEANYFAAHLLDCFLIRPHGVLIPALFFLIPLACVLIPVIMSHKVNFTSS